MESQEHLTPHGKQPHDAKQSYGWYSNYSSTDGIIVQAGDHFTNNE